MAGFVPLTSSRLYNHTPTVGPQTKSPTLSVQVAVAETPLPSPLQPKQVPPALPTSSTPSERIDIDWHELKNQFNRSPEAFINHLANRLTIRRPDSPKTDSPKTDSPKNYQDQFVSELSAIKPQLKGDALITATRLIEDLNSKPDTSKPFELSPVEKALAYCGSSCGANNHQPEKGLEQLLKIMAPDKPNESLSLKSLQIGTPRQVTCGNGTTSLWRLRPSSRKTDETNCLLAGVAQRRTDEVGVTQLWNDKDGVRLSCTDNDRVSLSALTTPKEAKHLEKVYTEIDAVFKNNQQAVIDKSNKKLGWLQTAPIGLAATYVLTGVALVASGIFTLGISIAVVGGLCGLSYLALGAKMLWNRRQESQQTRQSDERERQNAKTELWKAQQAHLANPDNLEKALLASNAQGKPNTNRHIASLIVTKHLAMQNELRGKAARDYLRNRYMPESQLTELTQLLVKGDPASVQRAYDEIFNHLAGDGARNQIMLLMNSHSNNNIRKDPEPNGAIPTATSHSEGVKTLPPPDVSASYSKDLQISYPEKVNGESFTTRKVLTFHYLPEDGTTFHYENGKEFFRGIGPSHD